jgi:DNA invertase Pin-like site-specific DNA recombinase
MNIVIYARVSSQGPRQSTDRQVEELKCWAVRNGHNILRIFEEHMSGIKKNQERNKLVSFLEFCSSQPVDCVAVSEISRLGRSTLEVLKTLEELHRHRISVYIYNIGMETLLPDGTVNPVASILTTVLAEMARIEWNTISERLESGRRRYIEKGGRMGRPKGVRKGHEQYKEEYKDAIQLLKKGYSVRNVAKLTEHSASSIQKIKKICL